MGGELFSDLVLLCSPAFVSYSTSLQGNIWTWQPWWTLGLCRKVFLWWLWPGRGLVCCWGRTGSWGRWCPPSPSGQLCRRGEHAHTFLKCILFQQFVYCSVRFYMLILCSWFWLLNCGLVYLASFLWHIPLTYKTDASSTIHRHLMTTHTGSGKEIWNDTYIPNIYYYFAILPISIHSFAVCVSFRQHTCRRWCQVGESKHWHDRLLHGSLRQWRMGWDDQATFGKPHCSELQRQDSVDTEWLSTGHVSMCLYDT